MCPHTFLTGNLSLSFPKSHLFVQRTFIFVVYLRTNQNQDFTVSTDAGKLGREAERIR